MLPELRVSGASLSLDPVSVDPLNGMEVKGLLPYGL